MGRSPEQRRRSVRAPRVVSTPRPTWDVRRLGISCTSQRRQLSSPARGGARPTPTTPMDRGGCTTCTCMPKAKLTHLVEMQNSCITRVYETLVGWATHTYEMYAICDPLISRSRAVAALTKLSKWAKKEENNLFILSAPTFN